MITRPDWVRRPDGEDLDRYYPDRAREQEISGRVRLSCVVAANGSIQSCDVTSETPPGAGFGEASRRAALREFRMRPQTKDGQPVGGARVNIPITWTLPDD